MVNKIRVERKINKVLSMWFNLLPHPFFYESIFSLHIDFLNSSRWLPAGVPMKLKFIRNDDNFVIIANAAPGTYKIKIIELFVEFRKIGVDISIMKREHNFYSGLSNRWWIMWKFNIDDKVYQQIRYNGRTLKLYITFRLTVMTIMTFLAVPKHMAY